MRRFGDNGVRFAAVAVDQIQVAEDQELLDFAEIQLVNAMFPRQGEYHVGLQGVPDQLLLARNLDRLRNNRTRVQ